MNVEQMIEALTPCIVHLSGDFWLAAAALAGVRKAVNDERRVSDRDRGEKGNRYADLAGAAGELLALGWTTRRLNEMKVRHNLLSLESHIDDVDVRIVGPEATLLLEAKAEVLKHNTRLFLINERAHKRSAKRGAYGYLPLITSVGASRAFVGRVIPIADVYDWPTRTLGGHRDPAHCKQLEDATATYFDCRADRLRSLLVGDTNQVVSEAALVGLIDCKGEQLDTLRRGKFSLQDLPYNDIVQQLATLTQAGSETSRLS